MAAALSGVCFLQPLALGAEEGAAAAEAAGVECLLRVGGGFEVRSGDDGASDDAAVHCVGGIGAVGAWLRAAPAPVPQQ